MQKKWQWYREVHVLACNADWSKTADRMAKSRAGGGRGEYDDLDLPKGLNFATAKALLESRIEQRIGRIWAEQQLLRRFLQKLLPGIFGVEITPSRVSQFVQVFIAIQEAGIHYASQLSPLDEGRELLQSLLFKLKYFSDQDWIDGLNEVSEMVDRKESLLSAIQEFRRQLFPGNATDEGM